MRCLLTLSYVLFLCGDKSKRREVKPQESAIQSENSCINFGLFALRDIKPGEEIVLGREWEYSIVSGERHRPSSFMFQDGAHTSTILSNFAVCACGSPVESCVPSWCHRRNNGFHEEAHNHKKADQQPRHPDENQQTNSTAPSAHAKKKPKTTETKEEGARKTSAASTRRRKSATNGKRGATSKSETKDMDIDQDVGIDVKRDDLDVRPSLESPTNALATLSLRGSPENAEQKQRLSQQTELVVETVPKLSGPKEQTSDVNIPMTTTTLKGPRSRASSATNSLLEPPASHSPRSSAIKPWCSHSFYRHLQ